jgi:hypothetical protein
MFWTGLFIGLLVGTAFGAMIMAVVQMGAEADRRERGP